MADDLTVTLRSLANRWAMKARDFARASKEAGASESQAAYDRGFAEAYYRAATELAEVLKEQGGKPESAKPEAARPTSSAPAAGASAQREAASAAPAPAAPPPPAPSVTYASVSVGEVLSILVFAGCQPRDATPNKDNSIRATFSSWGSMMLHEQIDRIQKADPRIVILNSGKLESHDYYVDFAFKED